MENDFINTPIYIFPSSFIQMKLILFDVDGTLCESGKKITLEMSNIINDLVLQNIQIGIVGGGTYEKIIYQLDNKIKPDYIFSECGSVYHKLINDSYILINKNNLRLEPEYTKIIFLIKTCLSYISKLECMISGNFIDLRNGLFYISLPGMVANDEERNNFIENDKLHQHRKKLIDLLKLQAIELNIDDYLDICFGGNVGIAIYPKKWNKTQVLSLLKNESQKFTEMHYFGDKYLPNGNDYDIMNANEIIPHCVDNPTQTYNVLKNMICEFYK